MQNQTSSDLIGQRTQRIENMRRLRELGINPYPARSKKEHNNAEIKEHFAKFENKTVTLTGRLMAKREHGKLIFGDLQDQSGSIQIAIKKDQIETNLKEGHLGWAELKFIDIGDFVQITGEIVKTQQGEITIFATQFTLLAKSIRPLPVQLDDKEQQFRRRYLDLTVNTKNKELFERKSKFWLANRRFMQENGFMEVETPVLEHVTGGADATPFTTHHNALDQEFFLRISTELYQKRLVGGGFEKIFTIGPNFRNEGLSDEHLQEFYQNEWYWAYADYRDNMKLVRDIFRYIAKEVYGKTKFTTRGHSFDLSDDWKEISYPDVIKERFNIDIFEDSDEKMMKVVKEQGLELSGAINRNRLIDNLWKLIRKEVSGPAFLINEPKFMSPLAKSKPEDDRITERFHVLIAGSELGNGYTEINDPMDQLDRFLEQQNMRESGDTEAQMLDIDYVEMLEYGMPPTSGYGMSERVFWFLEDITAREGTLFPQMRTEIDDITKKIYKDKIKFHQAVDPKQNTAVTNSPTDMSTLPTREKALQILEEHVKEPYQILHAKMVAAAMESYAKTFGEPEELWYLTGLLHDVDYHEYPTEHPAKSLDWFLHWGYPNELIHAVSAHAFSSGRTTTPPDTRLDYALVSCDEMSGLLYAYSLMRPGRFDGMEAKSALKKYKDKAFAAKIDRAEIQLGVDGLGIELQQHIQNLINVFKEMPEVNA